MGRKRTKDLDLPPRMRRKGLAYYYDAGGKPRQWIALGSDKPTALRKWAELEGGGESGTVAALIDRYLDSSFFADLRPATQYGYKRWTITLRKVFGAMRPQDVRPHHVARFLDEHPKKILANKQIAVLATIFEKGMRWGVLDINPTRGVRRNPVRARSRYLSDGEFRAIRAHAAPLLQIAMDLAYLTGMRQGDICKAMLADIHDGALWVTQTKTGKKQAFQLTPELNEVIAAAKALPRPVRGLSLLCTRRGKPYSPTTIKWYWRLACVAAGIEDAHFHDLRAKAGTDAKAAGQDHQALLGHTNRAMSDRYVKARETDRVTPILRKL